MNGIVKDMSAERSLEEKRELRQKILVFFATPKLNRNIARNSAFADGKFSSEEIKEVILCLERTGLLFRVRGQSAGSVYVTSDDGLLLGQALDIAKNTDSEDKE